MALDEELVRNVREVLARREEAEPGRLVLNERVDIELVTGHNGPFQVTKGDFGFQVDEPPIRGGADTAPNPLAFFVAGAATCYLSHFMMLAMNDTLELDTVRMSARARFDRRAVGGHLQRLVYKVDVSGDVAVEAIDRIARLAEKMCYAHNTLVKAGVLIETHVDLDGTPVCSLEADTTHM